MPAMHEIDYQIFGHEMQYVEVELDPMEAAVAEAGGMIKEGASKDDAAKFKKDLEAAGAKVELK